LEVERCVAMQELYVSSLHQYKSSEWLGNLTN